MATESNGGYGVRIQEGFENICAVCGKPAVYSFSAVSRDIADDPSNFAYVEGMDHAFRYRSSCEDVDHIIKVANPGGGNPPAVKIISLGPHAWRELKAMEQELIRLEGILKSCASTS